MTNVTDRLIRTLAFTASITKMVKVHAKIAVIKETKFYDRGTTVGNESNVEMLPSLLTGRCTVLSSSSKHDEKKSTIEMK